MKVRLCIKIVEGIDVKYSIKDILKLPIFKDLRLWGFILCLFWVLLPVVKLYNVVRSNIASYGKVVKENYIGKYSVVLSYQKMFFSEMLNQIFNSHWRN